MPPTNPPSDNSRLDGLIASYLEALERGEQPDRQQLLAAQPEDAEALARFFADLDKVEATKLQAQQAPDVTFIPQHEPKPGAIFGGRYKLLENIGEGGMGSVWVAEQQQPVKRRVAIKLVKAGMDSKQVLARFEAERQALAPKLSPDTRVRTAELFIGSLYRVDGGSITKQLLKLMPQLERQTQDRISTEVMTILLDYLALSEDYFEINTELGDSYNDVRGFSSGVMAMTNERSAASLLQHPATTGRPRELLLQRFEELVFHNGNHVLLPLREPLDERWGIYENPPSAIPAADGNEHGGLTPNRSPSEPPPRRFHNLHDAATWIQQNWPDFDLEATHQVIWRGER